MNIPLKSNQQTHFRGTFASLALFGCLYLFNSCPTAVAQPAATTLAATGITATNATLNGTVNPNGALAAAYFQYGLTTNYDNLGGFMALPATNTAQTLPGLMVNSLRGAAGANWTPTSAPITNWQSIAGSADGTRLAAVAYGGGIYTSTNSGTNWTQTSAPITTWQNIASSADGTRLAAAAVNSGIYTSTNGGVTWTQSGALTVVRWQVIASSADGTRLAAAQYNGDIWTSTNSGVTWTHTNSPAQLWRSIASSADGKRLLAGGESPRYVYTSTDGGITWTQASLPSSGWYSVASSADGTKLAAASYGLGIYTSTNGGVTWMQTSGPSFSTCLCSSADGTRLAAGVNGGGIYTSSDGGVTWELSGAPSQQWLAIAASADCTRLSATAYLGGIYSSAGTATNLMPGTVYHYRVAGLNSSGTSPGSNLTFTTSSGVPTVITLGASSITASNAVIRGSLTTGGLNTSAYFRYGLTTNYGSFSTTNALAATNTSILVSNLISTLSLATTYHFQFVASNSAGISLGGDLSFTTRPLPPAVTTLPATGITPTNATLHGTVNPKGAFTTEYFQYGLTTNYDTLAGLTFLAATNATITLPGLVLDSLRGAAGANWTPTSAPNTNYWTAIVSSADGSRLAAAAAEGGVPHAGGIYTSTNFGSTWTKTSFPDQAGQDIAIASSADGSRLTVAIYTDIYSSTNGGATWTQPFTVRGSQWTSIASSADGSRLAAATAGAYALPFTGGIYTSTNFGLTWTQTSAPLGVWTAITCSADGTRLAASDSNSGIHTSTDGGITWTQRQWWGAVPCMASSADGMKLAGAQEYGIFASTDGGANWAWTSAPITNCQSIAVSADGTRLAAVGPDSEILTSTNGGSTWTRFIGPATLQSIASSADGTRLAAVKYGGGIYTSAGGVSNLMPATTYHYRAVGCNTAGTTLGNDLTFFIPGTPTATTLSATSINATNATLNGTVNPNAAATSAYFRYGLTTNYGSYTLTNTFPATNLTFSVLNFIGNLISGTTYHFQLVTSNSLGISLGVDFAFTTLGPPVATTLPATGVTPTNATLNGTVNPNGVGTTVYFRYGSTTNYGSYTATNTLAATNFTWPASSPISNLTSSTSYHFQLVTSNSVGMALGGDVTFTSVGPPIVTTMPATSITTTNATISGSVNPMGDITRAYFQYGLTTNYDNQSPLTQLSATNVALNLPGLVVAAQRGTAGTSWTQTPAPASSAANWISMASSADGSRLAAVMYGGGVYLSSNAGSYWTLANLPNANWFSIACSADASRLVAVADLGGIYSSPNGGLTWALTSAPNTSWRSVASSADGTRLTAVENSGGIYTSTDGGGTWIQTSAPIGEAWWSVASSADGSRLAAVAIGGGIYISTNAGSSWTQASAPATNNWYSIASSADGTRLAAAVSGGGIYTSLDGGITWTITSALATSWRAVASSASGLRLAAVEYYGGIYASTDGGNTWTKTSAPANTPWYCIASSVDGGQLAAGIYRGGIYTSTGPTNNLTPGTTYHYRVVGWNAEGTSVGSDLTFTTSLEMPTATTLAASGITTTNATLNGAVTTGGLNTSAYFQYGLTTNYGSYSATNALAATNVTLSVSNLAGSLTPGTTYHFQLVAGNSLGTSVGNDMTFVTPVLPAVTTLPAASITATNATLNGTVNPNGTATSVYFRYGLTTNYGSYSATNALAATNVNLSVSKQAGSLTPGTTYHFQLVAGNNLGTSLGNDMTFVTVALPAVTTLPAASITATNAILNGTVNPNGAASSAYFQYGLTTNYGSYSATNALAATNVTLSVSNLAGSLTPGTTYHYRAVSYNIAGVSYGNDLTFTTSPGMPTVTTLAATGVTTTNATFNGAVTTGGLNTSAYFQYGMTTNYGSYSATNNLAATNMTQAVSSLIGLSPVTTYHFRLVAFNSAGSAAGADRSIVTVVPHAFTGADPGQGLDLQGTFLYAVNVGSNGAPGLIGDANFTADNVPGVTITAPGNTLKTVNAWANPNFGATTDGLRLAQAMSSIRWTSVPGILTVNLAGLQAGSSYQLQLLFLENSDDRVFDVKVNGTTIVPAFRLLDYGPMGTAIVIPYVFTATSTNALIQLGGGTGGVDNNPLLSAFTLENLSGSPQPQNFSLVGPIQLPGGAFQFSFTNLSGLGFTVLATTNLALPLSNWTVLGAPIEAPPGQYQFTDTQATNSAIRFYRVRSP